MNTNVAAGIMTSVNLLTRFTACKNTWLKDFKYTYMFGGFIRHPDLICLGNNVMEDYNSAIDKQFLGLKYMYEQTAENDEVQWYYFVGCDTYAFVDNITEMLKEYDSTKELYLGGKRHSGEVNMYLRNPPNFKLMYASGGPGFFISKALMKRMYSLLEPFTKHWKNIFVTEYNQNMHPAACDNALAYMLWKCLNVFETFVDDDRYGFYHCRPEDYKSFAERPIAFHYIKPEEMYKWYEDRISIPK